MTTYTKITDYASKDALLTGNPSKVVRGTEIDAEFTAIASADADSVKTSALGTGVATFLATPSSANLAAAVTGETGSGALVFGTSPTLVTPALGTPSALVGTNITGTAAGLTAGNVTTNANLTGHVTSVGNAAVLGSFTSAQLATALTDETGSGANVFATSPTLVTPNIGVATGTSFQGIIGNVTPAAGTFTTLTSTGNAALGDAEASDTHAIKGATTLLANSASAALTVTQTGAGNAFVVEDSASADSTPFVIDASGKVILGTTVSVAGTFGTQAPLQNLSFGTTTTGRFFNDASAPALDFIKSRNSTIGSHTVVQSGDALADLYFSGSDGTAFIRAAQITAAVDGTPGTNDMPGRLIFSTTADGASSPTEALRINSAQAIGIGTALSQVSLYNTRNLSGNTSSYGFYEQATVQSDVTTAAFGFSSNLSTAAAAFTLVSHYGFYSGQGTIGAASAITNNYGFFVDSTLTGATNNYGFYSNIASTANRYNFYAAGTAPNYFAGDTTVAGNLTANGQTVGYLNIPQNSQSAPYTLVLGDAGKHILHPSADTTARTITIPANSSVAFPIGTAVTFVNQASAGVMTIAITTDTMRLAGAGTTGSRALAANGVATAIKLTSTEWIISGTNLT